VTPLPAADEGAARGSDAPVGAAAAAAGADGRA
jgi:hypothetical protein